MNAKNAVSRVFMTTSPWSNWFWIILCYHWLFVFTASHLWSCRHFTLHFVSRIKTITIHSWINIIFATLIFPIEFLWFLFYFYSLLSGQLHPPWEIRIGVNFSDKSLLLFLMVFYRLFKWLITVQELILSMRLSSFQSVNLFLDCY